MTDERYMRLALIQAEFARRIDEVPIGAVIVHNDQVIAAAHNTRESTQNPVAHAEITAILAAAQALQSWRLCDCTLYVTLEPCPMCAGAIINARIPTVVFGAWDAKAGAFGTLYDLSEGKLNHTPQIRGGILEEECANLLSSYFKEKRGKKTSAKP